MKKNANNKTLKIVAATAMSVFSLFSVFMGTYAWFISDMVNNSGTSDFNVSKLQSSIKTINFYNFLGTSVVENGKTYYGFNPVREGYVTIDGSDVDDDHAPTVRLGTYSIVDPHHPLLMVCELNNSSPRVVVETDYAYLGSNTPAATYTTVATYAALKAVVTTGLADGTVYQVTTDEDHGDVLTQYTFDGTNKQWNMTYLTLKQDDNPLSSVAKLTTFTFSSIPTATTHTLNTYTDATQESFKPSPESVSCIAVDTALFTSSNTKSFVEMNGDNFKKFNTSKELINDSVGSSINYIGIVIDYYPESLDYICSRYLGHRYLNSGLTFKCDWRTFI